MDNTLTPLYRLSLFSLPLLRTLSTSTLSFRCFFVVCCETCVENERSDKVSKEWRYVRRAKVALFRPRRRGGGGGIEYSCVEEYTWEERCPWLWAVPQPLSKRRSSVCFFAFFFTTHPTMRFCRLPCFTRGAVRDSIHVRIYILCLLFFFLCSFFLSLSLFGFHFLTTRHLRWRRKKKVTGSCGCIVVPLLKQTNKKRHYCFCFLSFSLLLFLFGSLETIFFFSSSFSSHTAFILLCSSTFPLCSFSFAVPHSPLGVQCRLTSANPQHSLKVSEQARQDAENGLVCVVCVCQRGCTYLFSCALCFGLSFGCFVMRKQTAKKKKNGTRTSPYSVWRRADPPPPPPPPPLHAE